MMTHVDKGIERKGDGIGPVRESRRHHAPCKGGVLALVQGVHRRHPARGEGRDELPAREGQGIDQDSLQPRGMLNNDPAGIDGLEHVNLSDQRLRGGGENK
jgi:hypothetical protein